MTISDNSIDSRIEETLQEIAHTIQIRDDFSITHSQYAPVGMPDEMQARLRQMPESVLEKYLQVKLQTLIYNHYHYSPITQETFIIENHTTKWSKSEFYYRLCTNNHCKDRFESGWLVTDKTKEGFLLVSKNDLTLHIGDRHLPTQQQNARIGDSVAIAIPPQLVEPGYYIAVSSQGSINDLLDTTIIVDIYFHVSSDGAIALMDRLTTQLELIAIPFHFKVLYHPDTYQRCDAAVLSVTRNDYTQIQSILTDVYRETRSHFRSEIPLFTKHLADGVGIAERILAKNSSPVTSVQYCSELIAEGLVNAWKADRQTPEIKFKCICDRFTQQQIDFQQPYLNPNSTDIYSLSIAD